MPDTPGIEWRMIKRRHHVGFVDDKRLVRIEENEIVPSVLELFFRGKYIESVANVAAGKRLAQQLLKEEIARKAQRLLPVDVQREIADAVARAVQKAVIDTQEAVLRKSEPVGEEAEDLLVHDAAYTGLKRLIESGLLNLDGIKA